MLGAVARGLRAYAEKDGRGYPDWAIRYVPLVRRIEGRLAGSPRVLEIGANENGLSRFADVEVIAVDVAIDGLKAARSTQRVVPVVAEAGALPFRSGSFHCCVCVDTFEHLQERERESATREIARVLGPSGTAAIAFPTGDAAARMEAIIRKQYHRFTGEPMRWLEEHAQCGLPDAERTVHRLETLVGDTHRVSRSRNGNLLVWRWMWQILACGWPGRGNALFQALLRLATPVLCRIHLGSCYRALIWVEPKEDD